MDLWTRALVGALLCSCSSTVENDSRPLPGVDSANSMSSDDGEVVTTGISAGDPSSGDAGASSTSGTGASSETGDPPPETGGSETGDSASETGAEDDGSTVGECEDVTAPEGLIAHLRFDETTGLSASDASGNGNAGTLVGMPMPGWSEGVIDGALEFDGIDDAVNLGSAASVDNLGSLTACAWIRMHSFTSGYPTIADKSLDAALGGWNFFLDSDGTFGFLTNRREWAFAGDLGIDVWHHVCVTWDGSEDTAGIRLFQDGLERPHTASGSEGTAVDNDASRDLIIGRANDGSEGFDGFIDDFRLYDRELTHSEVDAVHACGAYL